MTYIWSNYKRFYLMKTDATLIRVPAVERSKRMAMRREENDTNASLDELQRELLSCEQELIMWELRLSNAQKKTQDTMTLANNTTETSEGAQHTNKRIGNGLTFETGCPSQGGDISKALQSPLPNIQNSLSSLASLSPDRSTTSYEPTLPKTPQATPERPLSPPKIPEGVPSPPKGNLASPKRACSPPQFNPESLKTSLDILSLQESNTVSPTRVVSPKKTPQGITSPQEEEKETPNQQSLQEKQRLLLKLRDVKQKAQRREQLLNLEKAAAEALKVNLISFVTSDLIIKTYSRVYRNND
jgi:hypothetical protein